MGLEVTGGTEGAGQLSIPDPLSDLPDGYRYGAHVSLGGGSVGYWIIRDRDGGACIGVLRRDLEGAVGAEEIEDAIGQGLSAE